MDKLRTLLLEFRGSLSWGRFCSAIALTVAVAGELMGRMNHENLALWLGVAVGNYAAAKVSEAICVRSGNDNQPVE